MKNIFLRITDYQPDNFPLVLATVTGTSGSTPQKPGSSMLIGQSGLLAGTIGGGVLEGQVQQIAQKVIESKESGIYFFDLDHDIFHKEDAICGGQASVLVDANPLDHMKVYEQLGKSLEKRIPGVMVTLVTRFKDNKVKIHRYWITGDDTNLLPQQFIPKIEPEVKSLLLNGKPGSCSELEVSFPGEKESVLFFMEAIFPQPHLLIAGAGHIGKALSTLGKLLDFEVTVIDDRAEFANAANLPDADNILVEDIGKGIEGLRKTKDTYIVIVTRGHKDDEKALRPCIGSDVAYIGMIGSRNKVGLMRENFITNSWATKEQWARVFSPVGLEINSKTVWEIAVSIGAQLILVKNKIVSENQIN